jgi:hypothetical protein
VRTSNIRSGASSKPGWAIRSSHNLRRRQRIKAGLWFLAAGQALSGVWALAAPRSFFDGFPGLGLGWVAALPKYSEHLVRDLGAFNLAFAILFVWVAAGLERGAVTGALVSWLVFAIPHAIFHLFNLEKLSSTSKVVQLIALGITVLVPIVLIVAVGRLDHRRGPMVLR